MAPASTKPSLAGAAGNATPWASGGICGEATPMSTHVPPGTGQAFFSWRHGRPGFLRLAAAPPAGVVRWQRRWRLLQPEGTPTPASSPAAADQEQVDGPQGEGAPASCPQLGLRNPVTSRARTRGQTRRRTAVPALAAPAIGRSPGHAIRSCPPAAKASAGSGSHCQRPDQPCGFLPRTGFGKSCGPSPADGPPPGRRPWARRFTPSLRASSRCPAQGLSLWRQPGLRAGCRGTRAPVPRPRRGRTGAVVALGRREPF